MSLMIWIHIHNILAGLTWWVLGVSSEYNRRYRLTRIVLSRSRRSILTSLLIVLTSLLVVSVTAKATSAQVLQDSATIFYSSLVNSIQNADGRVKLSLRAGCWKSTIENYDVEWLIASKNQKAELRFHYADGAVMPPVASDTAATLKFDPSIQVGIPDSTADGHMVWNTVAQITYGKDGDVNSPAFIKDDFDVEKHFSLDTGAGLFFGRPFINVNDFSPVSGESCPNPQEPTSRKVIREVLFAPDQQSKALRLELKPNAVITFGTKRSNVTGSADNFVKVDAGSFVEFSKIHYVTASKLLEGNLNRLDLKLSGGEIRADDFALNPMSSRLTFDHVSFLHDPSGSSVVKTDSGELVGEVGPGSQLNLATAASQGSFTFAQSSVNLDGFTLSIDDSGPAVVQLTQDSRFDLHILSGQMGFGLEGSVLLDSGDVTAILKGKWGAGSALVQGRIVNLAVSLSGGQMNLTDGGAIRVNNGRITATRLIVDSTNPPTVTGPFDSVKVSLFANDEVKIMNGLSLTSRDNALMQGDSASPLTIERGRRYPIGKFNLDIPYRTLSLKPSEQPHTLSLNLINGAAQFTISTVPDIDKRAPPGSIVFRAERMHMDGHVDRGEMPLGDIGWLKVAGKNPPDGALDDIDLTLQGEWKPNYVPKVNGTVNTLDVTIPSGLLRPNVSSRLTIIRGTAVARSGSITIDTERSRPISGAFDELKFGVDEEAIFALDDSFSLVANSSPEAFAATDEASPLTIPANGPVSGKFGLNLNVKRLVKKTEQTDVTEATAQMLIDQHPDGSVQGSNISLSGQFYLSPPTFTPPFQICSGEPLCTPKPALIRASLANGSFTSQTGADSKLTGDLSAELETALCFPVYIPGNDATTTTDADWRNNHQNQVEFNLRTQVTVPDKSTISPTGLSFVGDHLALGSDIELPVKIRIPAGDGEHPNSQLNECGNNGGPDDDNEGHDDRHNQEVYTDTFGPSRVHAYLQPQNLGALPTFRISHDGSTLVVELTHLNLSDLPAVNTDGAQGIFAKAVAVIAAMGASYVTANPAVAIAAGYAGYKWANDFANNLKVKKILEFTGRLTSFSRCWCIGDAKQCTQKCPQ